MKPNGNKRGKNEGEIFFVANIYIQRGGKHNACCQDGKAKENHHPTKSSQARNHRDARKLEEYCLSRIIGNVSAQYIQTHTSHAPGISIHPSHKL